MQQFPRSYVYPYMRTNRAFTLIELLVVLSIIAILIGLLMPVLASALNSARKATCGSNLRQVGLGIQMYKDDWADVFPTARYMPEPFISGDDDPPLHEQIDNYLAGAVFANADLSIFQCPGDSMFVHRISGTSYMYQSELSGVRIEEFFPVKFFGVSPVDVVVCRDFDGGVFSTTSGDVEVPPFHDLRNLLFADGHVGNFE